MSTSDSEFEDEGLSISEIFQRAIDYWTPERIQNAVPFDDVESMTSIAACSAVNVQPTTALPSASQLKLDGDDKESAKSRIESDFPGGGQSRVAISSGARRAAHNIQGRAQPRPERERG